MALESMLSSHSASIHSLPCLSQVTRRSLIDLTMMKRVQGPSVLRDHLEGSATRQPLCMAFMRSRGHDLAPDRRFSQVGS
jgi:hypothetical protein